MSDAPPPRRSSTVSRDSPRRASTPSRGRKKKVGNETNCLAQSELMSCNKAIDDFVKAVEEVAAKQPPSDEVSLANQGYAAVTEEAFLREKFDVIRQEYDKVCVKQDTMEPGSAKQSADLIRLGKKYNDARNLVQKTLGWKTTLLSKWLIAILKAS